MIETTPERKAILLGKLFQEIESIQNYLDADSETKPPGKSNLFIRDNLKRFACVGDILDDAANIAGVTSGSMGTASKDIPQMAYMPLQPVFKSIHIQKGIAPERNYFYTPASLNIDDIFPTEEKTDPPEHPPDSEQMRQLLQQQWESFKAELKTLPEDLSFDALFDTLYAFLERWTANVGCIHGAEQDTPLFDHARAEAAYHDCLSAVENKESPFLVIEGDVSGIQGFIYKLANISEGDEKGSSKTLRGRSLYIVLLSESIADYILKRLGLYKVHLLMNGGGHFHLLVPNTAAVCREIDTIERTVNEWLLKEYKGELGLVISCQEFSETEMKHYSEVKKAIARKLAEKKGKKNLNLFGEINVFGPFSPGDENVAWDVCKLCESDYPKHKGKTCGNCESHRKLGESLPKIQYLIKVYADTLPDFGDVCSLSMEGIGVHWLFLKESDKNKFEKILSGFKSAARLELNTLNTTDFAIPQFIEIQKKFTAQDAVLGFRFIGKYVPHAKGKVLAFDQIAEESKGYPLLHILRMDVDSLGKIFAFGIDPARQTISRIANLSRQMNLFFCGYLNKLAEEHRVYLTYSGGDDLFAVGKWNRIIDFARAVQKDFARFTCHNPNLSISGGAVLVRSGFPIRRAAQLAGEKEHDAKNFKREPNGKIFEKNAFSLFNEVRSWDRIAELVDWGADFARLFEHDQESKKYRSLLLYLKRLRDYYSREENRGDLTWISRVRHKVYYMLARRAGITDATPPSEASSIDKLKIEILGKLFNNTRLLDDIPIPANYAILQTREPKN